MKTLVSRLFPLFAAVLLALPLAARADVNELKPPVPVENGGKIEVIEFFWYGCIHCYNLEPQIEAWLKTLPKDVEFRRVPTVFNERWALDASIFYALEAMGLLDKLHRPLFDAIHKERLRTDNEQALGEWLTQHGVDAKKFMDALQSFGVRSKTRRAVQLTLAYKIEGTPAMAVHGRYTVSAQAKMMQVVDSLVERVRQEK
ncbi:MAG TPA: thiol:disulfide interchange protein DsbA/DsbL [Burkholderiales bacterium]|nr:thiol:disulfide interchange protein DsbA/DsbL [Burkholderiales bacterium]